MFVHAVLHKIGTFLEVEKRITVDLFLHAGYGAVGETEPNGAYLSDIKILSLLGTR